ncbi:hypothetical protein BESB_084090 [Besnoitia besnoiti]|uniref:Signal recognition particle subunit SRP68 n=1 Tax=Besnoitia besnoiti TaxID=94643 RepID=A0A2A9MCT7_BESBE|nr:hypothetical protein BESB_084090 [Besnoitia besnoiti]PFH33210.1 hypothetical protein BESB_084090 [Besnoitia besnoiti]
MGQEPEGCVQVDEETLFASFSLPLTLQADERREANGLRHGDFLRYRRYCTARLDRLRASLDLRQGRHRYQAKKLPLIIRDERVLLLVQAQAERAWSYGMQLKGENAAAAVSNPRVRAHAIRRLSKALLHAELLEALCNSQTPALFAPPLPCAEKSGKACAAAKKEGDAAPANKKEEIRHGLLARPHALTQEEIASYFASLPCELVPLCDEKTKIEARAYRLSMRAALLQEQERWDQAAETLQELQQAYAHLKRVSSTQDKEQALFKKLLNEVEPQLRLCAFHAGGVASFARAAAAASVSASGGGGAAAAAAGGGAWMARAAKAARSEGPSLAVWRGEEICVSADRPRAGILGATALLESTHFLSNAEVEALAKGGKPAADVEDKLQKLSPDDEDRLVAKYGELSNRFRLCVDLIHAEMLRQPDAPSWLVAEGFCLDVSRCLEVERDVLLLLRFFFGLRRSNEKSQTAGGSRRAHASRGDVGARYASLLQQGVGKMMEEENLDEARRQRMQQWTRSAKDSRALCLAVFDASIGKVAEAYVLSAAVASRTKPLAPHSQLASLDDPQGRLDVFFVALERVVAQLAHRFEARYLAALVREDLKASGAETVETASALAVPAFPVATLRREKVADAQTASAKKLSAHSEMIAAATHYVLPRLEPVPCKPLLFDLAITAYGPPDLKARSEGTGSKRAALRGFVKSLFGR